MYKCKKCSGQKTVEWDEEYKIWICWKCGWIDKQRGKKK
jgi:transcription initiation factor TFIIIB Brf1 subunit/transcription initiation factor TFIIB